MRRPARGSKSPARWWVVAGTALVLSACATGGGDFELGEALSGQRKWDDAIRAYQAAIEKEPDNAQYRTALGRVRAAAADEQLKSVTAVAGAMAQLAEVDRGLAAIERALAYDPGHGPSRSFQATLRERRAGLASEIDRRLAEAREAIQRREWTRADEAVARVLTIDPANAVAPRLREDSVRGAVQQGLERASQAEAAEDWREAVRALEEALARDPSSQAAQDRLRTARQRDSLAYYLGRASQAESEGQLPRAYGFLRVATKYWASDVRLRDAMDRVAREGRRRYFTDALARAEREDWGRVYAVLAEARDAFDAVARVDPPLRELTRNLAARLYDRALEFENEKLWGNMFLWFRAVQEVDPLYRDTAARVEQTRDRLMDRATVKLAVLEFEAPSASRDAGAILSGSIVTNLFKLGRRDFRVIERDALQPIIKEQSIGQAGVLDVETAKEIGKIFGIDAIVVGRVLQYKVDQNESEGRRTVTVQVGTRAAPNPEYDRYLAELREGRKKSTDAAPPQTIQEPLYQLFTYRVGTVTAIGYVSVSFRLVGVERGDIRLAEKIDEQEAFRQDFSEGVEAANIQAVPKNAPIPTEVLNRVTEKVVNRMVQLIAKHFANRQEGFLGAGREFERRRQFTRAVEEYMNCIASAELERTGERFAGAARGHVDSLLRQ
jgi:curli biogenesis system outer membrane secretion channel CsgG/tetratricopeptide (TPR) repeat protein